MFKEKSLNLILFCTALTLVTAAFQFLFPELGFLDGGLIVAVLLTMFVKKDYFTILFGIIGILLILLSAFYPRENLSIRQVVMQRSFSAALILLTVISVLYIKRLYSSMESDQHQVKALFDNATEGMILTNQKGEIVLINPAALRMFQYEYDDLLGKKIETLIPTRYSHSHVNYREMFYEHPSHRSMGQGRDLFAKTRSGGEFPVEVSLSFYRQKNETFVIAFLVDITQRKEYERNLIKQKEQLERVTEDIRSLNAELESKVGERTRILQEALHELEKSQKELSEALSKEKELGEIKSRFASMASHEFRTPLSTILSSAALMSRYTKEDEQGNRDRHIRRIKDSVRHLNMLLEDFLSLGKLEEGKVLVKPEYFTIQPFIEEILEEMQELKKPGQNIIFNSNIEEFRTDKKLLRNILLNLLSNAMKFSPENSEVIVQAFTGSDSLKIEVIDNGMGIPYEDLKHMFSSFFRAQNVTNIQGTGLGLHIVKRYVELLNGRVQLNSELGKGTTVTMDLPFLPD